MNKVHHLIDDNLDNVGRYAVCGKYLPRAFSFLTNYRNGLRENIEFCPTCLSRLPLHDLGSVEL